MCLKIIKQKCWRGLRYAVLHLRDESIHKVLSLVDCKTNSVANSHCAWARKAGTLTEKTLGQGDYEAR